MLGERDAHHGFSLYQQPRAGLHVGYKRWLETHAPFDPSPESYRHKRTSEDNADSHPKRQIMGREVVVAITNGKLNFRTWEQIFYGEFEGRCDERVIIKIISEWRPTAFTG